MDITSETPTQEILNNTTENRNGLMCALAGRVFQKSDGRMLKAYTNFGFKKLAQVIDAKRMGIFDFGVTIRQTDTGGYVFPMDTDAVLSASAGMVGKPLVQRNPYSAGIRVSFEFDPLGQNESELRLGLAVDGRPASEVWLFRWHR